MVHNFYEATSENVQLTCDLEGIECDLQMQYFYKEADTSYRFTQCLSVNVSTIPTIYVSCFVIATLGYNNIISLVPLIVLLPSLTIFRERAKGI